MSKTRQLPYGEKAEPGLNIRLAMEEASRCLLCEDAPCSQDCPAGTDPGRFIRSIRFRNFKGAAMTIRENNILGAVCAQICPQERLCEKACSRCGIDKPIRIGRLQAFAMEQEKLFGMKILQRAPACGKKVVCIGAGPASLAVAAELAKKGVEVTIFDENEKAGGVLRYGITPSRLPDEIIDQDLAAVEGLGVKFVQNHRVSAEELATLSKENDGVFVGAGLTVSKMIPGMKGTELKGVHTALSFLRDARTGKIAQGSLGRVVIVGGGDVAMDCASTARQLGAKSVYVSFVETMETMPASKKELFYATDLGVSVIPAFKPVEVVGDGAKATSVRFVSMDGDSSMEMAAETVVFAVGQKASDDFKSLKATEKIWIGGDLENGGKTVVDAVASGKRIAEEMAQALKI